YRSTGGRARSTMSGRRFVSLRTSRRVVSFPLMARIMTPLLSLPHSNAEVERLFSILRKVHTDYRYRLHADTVTAYIQCKMNIDSCCHELVVPTEMLKFAKSATHATD
ncbi:hypothetical protein LSAT2_024570, partial [Lamellibrachia satsuma]